MNPQDLPKGQSAEMASLDGRKPQNPPGVYRHEAAGVELIVLPDPKTTAQQDALVRLGFVWKAAAPTQIEIRDMQTAQLAKDLEDEKNGVATAPYTVPGTQSQVFNATATDTQGPGEVLAAKDAQIAALQTQLDQLTTLAPEATEPVALDVPVQPAEPAAEPVVPEAPVEAEAPAEAPVEAPAEAETPVEAEVPEAPVEETNKTKGN